MVAFPKRPLFYLCCLFQLKKHRWLNKSSLEDARPYFSMEAKKSKRREREREHSPYFLPDEANLHTAAKVRDGGRRGKRETKWHEDDMDFKSTLQGCVSSKKP